MNEKTKKWSNSQNWSRLVRSKTRSWIEVIWKIEKVSKSIIYLKSKNDSPNKTKNDSMISINNIMISNILHRNFLFVQKIDCTLHIFKSMDSHFASSIWNFLKNGQIIFILYWVKVDGQFTCKRRPTLYPVDQDRIVYLSILVWVKNLDWSTFTLRNGF